MSALIYYSKHVGMKGIYPFFKTLAKGIQSLKIQKANQGLHNYSIMYSNQY